MARLARVVAPGYPHHVTQRGNRRQKTFFGDDDYRAYVGLMADWCRRQEVAVWAYCLMPNHIHLIVVPSSDDGLRRAVGEAHRRYTREVNFREGWRGHLWQGRFASFVLDESWLWAAVRYIENNPVRAGLARRAEDWRWSSAAAHVAGRDDELVSVGPMLERLAATGGTWRQYLRGDSPAEVGQRLRRHESTGRPLGSEAFVEALEHSLGRPLRPQKRGPKPRATRN